jgi:hypothetical protein
VTARTNPPPGWSSVTFDPFDGINGLTLRYGDGSTVDLALHPNGPFVLQYPGFSDNGFIRFHLRAKESNQ